MFCGSSHQCENRHNLLHIFRVCWHSGLRKKIIDGLFEDIRHLNVSFLDHLTFHILNSPTELLDLDRYILDR